jgi:hypothetical protein
MNIRLPVRRARAGRPRPGKRILAVQSPMRCIPVFPHSRRGRLWNFFFDGHGLTMSVPPAPCLPVMMTSSIQSWRLTSSTEISANGYAGDLGLKPGSANTGTPEWSCLDVSAALADDHILFFRGGEGR